ncbi:penicillin-binding protein 1C [Winogradskyella maritima]|uniref:peptidoglycan glycosyltransferase n=1 Tax=Winogradskyella maritima TaxID=1517766 RepID=A0ABV8AID4_9FLAO|nr:penicillin-binding protein 1C [Winogradskyella maritima]
MVRIIKYIKQNKIKTIIVFSLLVAYYFCLPKHLFSDPTATVVTSQDQRLLGAKIADDGQWRFPQSDSLPEKFKICVLQFEDEYFYKHPGFNPISIAKALKQNVSSGKVKRGGSTITQQVIRLSRKGTKRTYFEKFKELILATRLEFRHSKDEILELYASHAPFGGNVVGLDAGAWRYFNRDAHDLSWSESATLAVLPNAPSLIYPGKNQERLLKKRNRLLLKLRDKGIIDDLTYKLSIAEDLPQKPYPLPQLAPHLVERMGRKHKGERIKTTIESHLQTQVNAIVAEHHKHLRQNEIHNIAVLVLDVKTRNVLSYVGNAPTDKAHQKAVDIINKPRSTGSILKPFLYSAMLDAGELLPNTLVADVPTQYGSYQPENYNQTHDGAVPASLALSRSLNVPAVRLLQSFGLEHFNSYLKPLHLKNINKNVEHYGLSLILGGAESNLWDLCKAYAGMSSTLNHFSEISSQYYANEFVEPNLLAEHQIDFGTLQNEKPVFDAGSIFLTYESMKQVNRPNSEANWEFYDESKPIAWKTGTSFGFRDAWAIGTTKDYVVGVWVGNADGEGRPGLVGVETSAPILFNIFDVLPNSPWFSQPYDEMQKVALCAKSGHRASSVCDDVQNGWIQKAGLKTKACPYHQLVHVDASEQFRVNSSCDDISNIKQKSLFLLPPLQAHYYAPKHPFYKDLPPLKSNCIDLEAPAMEFVYPTRNSKLFLPKDFNGKTNDVVLKVAHSKQEAHLFWYVDDTYIGTTKDIHDMAIQPSLGPHHITVVDSLGNEISTLITIAE